MDTHSFLTLPGFDSKGRCHWIPFFPLRIYLCETHLTLQTIIGKFLILIRGKICSWNNSGVTSEVCTDYTRLKTSDVWSIPNT